MIKKNDKKINYSVFFNVIIGFKNNESLNDHSGKLKLLDIDQKDRSKPCRGKRHLCRLCKSMKDNADSKVST